MTNTSNPNRTFASIIFIGKELDPDKITAFLGITPSRSFKRGDKRNETEKWLHGYWELCSSNMVNSSSLEFHFKWIIDQLVPIRQKLLALSKESEIKAEISCFSILPKGQTVLNLSSQIIKVLAEANLSVELDLFSDE
jgi:hypothetical protein